VSFFEPPPPPPEPQEHRQPEWVGPPENVLPASFPLALELARTDDVAIAAQGGLAYPNGFAFRLVLLRRKTIESHAGNPFHHWHHARGELDDEALRFGVQFSDGRKATVFDHRRRLGDEGKQTGPTLMQRGGSGGGRTWDFGFWVWPLPPDGPVAFVVEWPSEGIELTRAEIDASIVRAAAEHAETLWPENDGPSSPGGGVFSEIR